MIRFDSHDFISPIFIDFQTLWVPKKFCFRQGQHSALSGGIQVHLWGEAFSVFLSPKVDSTLLITVDGRNPAPVDRWFIPLFIGFQTSKVVQDFFHAQ